MTESASELDRLQRELEELDRQISHEYTKHKWQVALTIGGRSLGLRLPISSGLIFFGYVGFNVTAFAAGALLIALQGTWRELGVAIVVGSLFAFGSFIAQWWTVQVQFEREITDRVYGSTDRQRELGEQRLRVIERLGALHQPTDSTD